MTAHAAYLSPAIGTGYAPDRAAFFTNPMPLNGGNGWTGQSARRGVRTSTQPVDEQPVGRTGRGGFSTGFGGIFYNRVQLSPSVINLGNLLTEKATQVSLWNAFLTPQNVTSLAWVDAEGISISSPYALPYTLGALQEVLYTVTASTSGPSTIDAWFTWTIEGNTYPLNVIGNRIVVFPFLPDWADGLDEELAWLSTVERAFDGGEQRRELRATPRKHMTYPITLLSAYQASRLENMLFGWQARNFAVPIATDMGKLTVAVNVGGSTLSVNTTDLGFWAGAPALIRTDDDNYEAVDIQSVSTTTLTLVRPVTRTWAAGAKVIPLGVAHLPNQQDISRASDSYVTASLSWDFIVTDGNANVPTASAPVTYDSLEVWLERPDWSGRPSFTYDDAFVTYGGEDVGVLEFEQTSDFPSVIRQHSYLFRSRAAMTQFRAFLKRRSGRVVPCWIPSWNNDFFITADVTASSSALTVRNNGYAAFINAHAARRDIAIFLRGSSTPIMRRITSAVDNLDGTINLVLGSTVGTAFTVADVQRICHMNKFRLGSDKVTLSWRTTTKLQAVLNWVLVKD